MYLGVFILLTPTLMDLIHNQAEANTIPLFSPERQGNKRTCISCTKIKT